MTLQILSGVLFRGDFLCWDHSERRLLRADFRLQFQGRKINVSLQLRGIL